MTTKNKTVLAVIAAVVFAVCGVTAFAQGFGPGAGGKGFGGHGFRGHGFGKRMAAELGLTDAQQTQIKTILQNEKTSIQPLMQQLKANHEQLQAATKDGQFDEAQVRSIASQQAQTMTNLIVEREKVKSEIFKVLTPDQRAKAEQLRSQMKSRHEQFRQNHGKNAPAQPQQ